MRKAFLLAVAIMTLVVACSPGQDRLSTPSSTGEQATGAATPAQTTPAPSAPCFGAAALAAPAGDCPATVRGPLTPPVSKAADDKSDAYRDGAPKDENCFAYLPDFSTKTCIFGDPTSQVDIALAGDSHAGQWLPAVQGVARDQHWKITTYLSSRCVFAETLQSIGGQACLHWVHDVEQRIVDGHFDLVVLENSLNVLAVGRPFDQRWPLYEKGYVALLRKLRAAHLRLVGIRDNPAPHIAIPACLGAHPDDYGACAGTRAKWLPPEPMFTAIDSMHDPQFSKADLTDYICDGERCPAAVGGVPVYIDPTHLTATYAATLAPYLEPYLVKALKS